MRFRVLATLEQDVTENPEHDLKRLPWQSSLAPENGAIGGTTHREDETLATDRRRTVVQHGESCADFSAVAKSADEARLPGIAKHGATSESDPAESSGEAGSMWSRALARPQQQS